MIMRRLVFNEFENTATGFFSIVVTAAASAAAAGGIGRTSARSITVCGIGSMDSVGRSVAAAVGVAAGAAL